MDAQNIPPEVLAKLLELGGLQDKDELLQQQLAQAEALRKGGHQGYGPAGGAFAGARDAADSIFGALEAKDIRKQLEANIAAKTAGRQQAGGLLRGLNALPAQPFGDPNAIMSKLPGVGGY